VLNVLMSVAQWERETIGERTHDAMEYKSLKGERVGKVPFGYDLGADGVQLIPNEAEQRVLSLIGQLRAGGLSLRAIAAELTARGIPTKEGETEWVHTTIARIVKRAAA
jgi:DNA invertase Pin-like site-specific DNA recombinase